MYTFTVRNVNDALFRIINIVKQKSYLRVIAPRGKQTLEFKYPVATTYLHPTERVLTCPVRDANPFFHILESMWMLACRNDVEFLKFLLPRMAEFSDDGSKFHGAYGYRWKGQVESVIAELNEDRDSRRGVIGLWNSILDSGYTGKDMPCNCTIAFKIRDGRLNMTVFNRSNDIVLGAYGANAVHLSILQEYISYAVNAEVGTYTQFSDSFHLYPDEPATKRLLESGASILDPYTDDPSMNATRLFGLNETPVEFNRDMELFFTEFDHSVTPKTIGASQFRTRWWSTVIVPLWNAFVYHKDKDKAAALEAAKGCSGLDWRRAAVAWLERRA